jgi:threonine aldolase
MRRAIADAEVGDDVLDGDPTTRRLERRVAVTVMVSFSKGLGCPAGWCLAGPAGLMEEAWKARARFGGAMRQTGILTAACLYALDHNLERLAEDHANARGLAQRLGDHGGFRVVHPETNIVMLDLIRQTAEEAIGLLAKEGVKLSRFGPKRLRAVTHLDVTQADILRAGEIMVRVLM